MTINAHSHLLPEFKIHWAINQRLLINYIQGELHFVSAVELLVLILQIPAVIPPLTPNIFMVSLLITQFHSHLGLKASVLVPSQNLTLATTVVVFNTNSCCSLY
jgi:hypothetical protein